MVKGVIALSSDGMLLHASGDLIRVLAASSMGGMSGFGDHRAFVGVSITLLAVFGLQQSCSGEVYGAAGFACVVKVD